MDIRSLTLLAIKLIGLFFLVKAVAFFTEFVQMLLFSGTFYKDLPTAIFFTPVATYGAIGAILFLAPGKFANRVIVTGETESSSLYRLLPTAIRIVCLCFMFTSIYFLVYHWTEAHLSAGGKNPMLSLVVSHRDKARLLATGVQFVASLLGWFYAGKIADVTRKISKDG
jgi:hypothetical protein